MNRLSISIFVCFVSIFVAQTNPLPIYNDQQTFLPVIELYRINIGGIHSSGLYKLEKYTTSSRYSFLNQILISEENLLTDLDKDSITIIKVSDSDVPSIFIKRSNKKYEVYHSNASRKTPSRFLLNRTFQISHSQNKRNIREITFTDRDNETLVIRNKTLQSQSPCSIWFIKTTDYNQFINNYKNQVRYAPESMPYFDEKSHRWTQISMHEKIIFDSVSIDILDDHRYKLMLSCHSSTNENIYAQVKEFALDKLYTQSQYDSVMQKRENFKKRSELMAEQWRQEFEKKLKQEEEQRKIQIAERSAAIIKKYGKHYGNLINEGYVELGMTKEMCTEAWGEPDDINKTITYGLVSEQWVYEGGSYLYFENNKLTAIQN